jgi:transposase
VLEGRFTLVLANAQHVKNVPGRKTDAKDSEWIAELLQHGLLAGSFVPPTLIRDPLSRNSCGQNARECSEVLVPSLRFKKTLAEHCQLGIRDFQPISYIAVK